MVLIIALLIIILLLTTFMAIACCLASSRCSHMEEELWHYESCDSGDNGINEVNCNDSNS